MLEPVAEAQKQFSDPKQRARIRAWHEAGMPLLDMVTELGLPGFVGELRDAIAGLTPDEVAIVRAAMIATIDATPTGAVDMPVQCTLEVVAGPVTVTAGSDEKGKPVAVVTGNGKGK